MIKRIQKLEKKQISSWRERKEKFLELDREKKFIESDGEEGVQCTSLEQLLETQKTEVMVFWKCTCRETEYKNVLWLWFWKTLLFNEFSYSCARKGTVKSI